MPEFRDLKVGSVVTVTGKTMYEVTDIALAGEDPRYHPISVVSRASGIRRWFPLHRLCWPGDQPGAPGEPILSAASQLLDHLEKQFRLLVATETLLETLGVRVARVEGEDDCELTCERGRGKSTYWISLNEALDVEQQLKYLQRAWEYLLPANDERWVTTEWRTDEDDPAMESFALTWPASRSKKAR